MLNFSIFIVVVYFGVQMIKLLKEKFSKMEDSKYLPKVSGIYFVYNKDDLELSNPVYIGSATGKNGLYGRIHSQHLNSKYLEKVSRRNDSNVSFQAKFEIKNSRGEVCVDKSSFRRSIAIEKHLAPSETSVNYILNNFEIYFLKFDHSLDIKNVANHFLSELFDLSSSAINEDEVLLSTVDLVNGFILALEKGLIKELQPIYNVQGKNYLISTTE